MKKIKAYIEGYGSFEYIPWEKLRQRAVRYICTDYEDEPNGIDLYEVIDEKADDFGTCYATNAN